MTRKPKKDELWVKKKGARPFEITYVNSDGTYDIRYISSNQEYQYQERTVNWKPYEEDAEQKEDTMTNKLYEITFGEETKFGTKLAVNSAGQWVMEIKGTNEVLAVDAKSCQKVVPYSVNIKFLHGGQEQGYSYLADKGEFEVGDFLVKSNGNFAQVTAIDTKSEKATKRFDGWKLQATKIKVKE